MMNYDVVCIGGAVMGCAVAYFLTENPDFDGTVAIIETDPSYDRCSTSRAQHSCLLYTSPSPRDATLSRMPSSA